MPLIVAVDGVDGGKGVIYRAEGEKALAGREDLAQASFLSDNGLSACQIARVPLAESLRHYPNKHQTGVVRIRDVNL